MNRGSGPNIIKELFSRGQGNGTVGKVALHQVDPGSIPDIPFGPLSFSGVNS